MTILTREQIESIKSRMVPMGEGIPVRFLEDGCAVSISTGDKCRKGSNVIHHPVYWTFTKELAQEIASLTGTKPVWSGK
jgi:hypothetical protein